MNGARPDKVTASTGRKLMEASQQASRRLSSMNPSVATADIEDAIGLAIVQYLEHAPGHLVWLQIVQWLTTAARRNLKRKWQSRHQWCDMEELPHDTDLVQVVINVNLCRKIMGRCRMLDGGGWIESALTMRLHGHTDEEIAEASGLLAATTRQRLHRFFTSTRSWLASAELPGVPMPTAAGNPPGELRQEGFRQVPEGRSSVRRLRQHREPASPP